jgi:S-(hydroxymethyl)glutathione dehydrogenase/alcohol dehydrogenase
VVTGVGAVNNAARAQAGNSVVIIGAGGVGLNVAQGAALAKCDPIIAVDLRATALTLARDFGATHTVDAATQNAVEGVRELTHGRGADFVFDTVGAPSTITQAMDCARKGGSIVVTGLSRTDTLASIPAFPFVMQEKRLIGSLYGSGKPAVDIPRLAELYLDGKLKLRELVTHSYHLDEVNDALNTLAAGTDARGIIEW